MPAEFSVCQAMESEILLDLHNILHIMVFDRFEIRVRTLGSFPGMAGI